MQSKVKKKSEFSVRFSSFQRSRYDFFKRDFWDILIATTWGVWYLFVTTNSHTSIIWVGRVGITADAAVVVVATLEEVASAAALTNCCNSTTTSSSLGWPVANPWVAKLGSDLTTSRPEPGTVELGALLLSLPELGCCPGCPAWGLGCWGNLVFGFRASDYSFRPRDISGPFGMRSLCPQRLAVLIWATPVVIWRFLTFWGFSVRPDEAYM